MHEIAVAESIIQIADAKAREHNARITQVEYVQIIKLRVGTFTTIVPEALQFAFEVCRYGTLSQNARLEIEIVAMVTRCAVCKTSTQPVSGICLHCQQCGFPLEIVSGEELQIEYIEMNEEQKGLQWNEGPSESQSRPTY